MLIRNVSHARRRQLITAGQRNLEEVRPIVVIESSLSYLETNFFTLARQVEVPTLVITGKLDPLVPIEQISLLVNSLDYALLKVLIDHGHLGPLEAPGTVARLTDNFLDRVSKNILTAHTSEIIPIDG